MAKRKRYNTEAQRDKYCEHIYNDCKYWEKKNKNRYEERMELFDGEVDREKLLLNGNEQEVFKLFTD